jgi:hypothetical protein
MNSNDNTPILALIKRFSELPQNKDERPHLQWKISHEIDILNVAHWIEDQAAGKTTPTDDKQLNKLYDIVRSHYWFVKWLLSEMSTEQAKYVQHWFAKVGISENVSRRIAKPEKESKRKQVA